MKIAFVLVCTCAIFSIKKAHGSSIGAPFYPLNPEDLTDGEVKELEYWDKYYHRPKRTIGHPLGSAGIIVQLKTAALKGTKMKIVEIATGSVGNIIGASSGAKHLAGQAVKGLGGTLVGSVSGINQLKSALSTEVKKKLLGVAKASAGAATAAIAGASSNVNGVKNAAFGAISGSANAVKQLESAAFNSLTKNIAQASAGLGQASVGTIGASSSAVKNLKNAALSKVAKKITGASSGIWQASSDAQNAVKSLKSSLISGLTNQIGQIASGSAALATGASSGLHSKVKQVSGDIVVGGADVANQLKSAIHAGSKQKLGQAASGFAGAITGAVGSATAGIGQIARGVVSGSTDFISQLKSALFREAQKKIGLVVSASAGVSGQLSNSATSGVKSIKSGIIGGLTGTVGQLAAGSAGASGQALSAVKHLKQSASLQLFNVIGQVAQGSVSASSGASNQAFSAVKKLKQTASSQLFNAVGQLAQGSAAAAAGASGQLSNAVNQFKSAAFKQVANTIKQASSASASASGQASQGAESAILGSANAIKQLKNAAISHLVNKIGQAAQGSASASTSAVSGSANALHQLKSAAVNTIKKKISQTIGASGQLSQSGGSAVVGSAKGIFQLKSSALSTVHNTLKKVASGSADASSNVEDGVGSALHGLKDAAANTLHKHVSSLAEASAGDRKRRSVDEQLHHDLPKRSESAWSTGSGSGSADIISHLKTAVVAGLKQKIGQVAKGSAGAVAGASAGFSKGSSGGDAKGYHPHSYEPTPHDADDGKDINVWDLKKSVLNTLLQAVKAIKGGVLAIKGQLIKGSGFIVSGGGKLIAASGDKVTKLGKNIISNAVLVHPNKEHYTHSDYSSSYTAPSGPPAVYNAPSSSGHGYESHYENHYDEKLPGSHAGILILRKMNPTHDKYHSSHSHIDESAVPAFKPLASTGPTFGTVVGKFFTASTSLNPSGPSPFVNADIHPAYSYDAEQSHGSLSPPSPPHFEEPRNHFDSPPPPPTYQAPLIKEHKIVAPTLSNGDFSTSSDNSFIPPAAPLTTNYGAPQFQNINDYLSAEASALNEQKVKLTKGEIIDHLESSPTLASSEIQLPKDAPDSLQALKDNVKTNTLGPPFNSDYLPNNIYGTKSAASGERRPTEPNYLRNALYSEKHNGLSLDSSSAEASSQYRPSDYSRFQKTSSSSHEMLSQQATNSLANFLPFEGSKSSQEASNELTSKESYMKFIESFLFHKLRPSPSMSHKSHAPKSYSTKKVRTVRVPMSDHRQRKPSSRPDYSFVKSVSYEITPDGAKRLT